jgi:hypothetical protein
MLYLCWTDRLAVPGGPASWWYDIMRFNAGGVPHFLVVALLAVTCQLYTFVRRLLFGIVLVVTGSGLLGGALVEQF